MDFKLNGQVTRLLAFLIGTLFVLPIATAISRMISASLPLPSTITQIVIIGVSLGASAVIVYSRTHER